MPWDDLRGTTWHLVDPTDGTTLRTERRRPPRRAVRRARPLGLAPVPRDGRRLAAGRVTGMTPQPDDRRAPPAGRGDGPRRGRPVHRQPLVRVGPVPVRAGVGHRAGGLQRRAATRGARSRTTTPGRGRTAGTRTGWPGSPTSATSSAWGWRCGTARDPILKERMFGLTGPQGNHGEDVKEYWWYLEGLPSHACCAGATTTRRRRSPTRGWSRRTAGAARTRVRAARHRRVRRRPVLGGRRHLRQGVADRGAAAHRRSRTTGRTRRRSTCCRPCGSATPGVAAKRRRVRGSSVTATACSSRAMRLPGTGSRRPPARTGPPPSRCSATTRRTRARLFGTEPVTPYPKDGINDHVVSGAPPSTPTARHQGGVVVPR